MSREDEQALAVFGSGDRLTEEAERILRSRYGQRVAIRAMTAALEIIAQTAIGPRARGFAARHAMIGRYVMRRWRGLI